MLAVSGVMEGGGVAGLAQMRAMLSGGRHPGGGGYTQLETIEEGGPGRGGGALKRGVGGGSGSSGTLLESVRFLESQGQSTSSSQGSR